MSTGALILPINSAGAETRPSPPVIARFVSARHWRNRACNRVRQKVTTPGDRKSSNGHRGVTRNHGLRPRKRSMTKRSKHRCHLSARSCWWNATQPTPAIFRLVPCVERFAALFPLALSVGTASGISGHQHLPTTCSTLPFRLGATSKTEFKPRYTDFMPWH
jgi:hypothetical protein